MTKIHAYRLLKLATKLDSVPRKHFDISRFWSEEDYGSLGCALGWAATIGSFRRAGFTLISGMPNFLPATDKEAKVCDAWWLEEYEEESPTSYGGFKAGAYFFGLSMRECFLLFDPTGHDRGDRTTPKQVAAKVRAMVNERFPELVSGVRKVAKSTL